MLLVDDRGGPEGRIAIVRDLLNPLIAAGLPAVLSRLDSGDLGFIGKGPNGSCDIGIELKRLDGGSTDLIQSLRSGRLAGHQVPKMVGIHGAYDYGFLMVEGYWTHDAQGQIVVVKRGRKSTLVPIRGRVSAAGLDKQLNTLTLKAGLQLRQTNTRRDTIRVIGALYRWFTDKDWNAHSSHLVAHTPFSAMGLSPFCAALVQWPGIGVRTSKAVERHFGASIRRAALAGVDEWAAIEVTTDQGQVRRIGLTTAQRIVSFVLGETI